jgi:membrane associated rhomboid family serine protease
MEIAPVTFTLIFANAAISLWIFYSDPVYFENLAEWPYRIVNENKYYQMITSAFLHANFMHLFFNMFALFTFGSYLELTFIHSFGTIIGSLYFFIIYLVSLLTGSVLTVIFHFRNKSYVAVGASGAVSGIIFSYIIFYPMSTVYLFFFPMPAFIFALLYIIISVYGMKSRLGNIGHEAHLGGAFGGAITTLILIEGAMRILISHFR